MAVFRCRISPPGPICGGGFLDPQPAHLTYLTTTTSPWSFDNPMPSASSSKSSSFDPLKLLSEIQRDQDAAGPSTRPQNDEADQDDDDDFMSDKFLTTTEPKQPLTYTDKRRKLEAHQSRKAKTKSLKQREEEARQEGLDRDLLAEAEIVAGGGKLPLEGPNGERRWDLMDLESASRSADRGEAEDGTTKAMRMMLAMGYRRGEALGKRKPDSSVRETRDEEVEEEEEDDEEESESAEALNTAKRNNAPSGSVLSRPPDDADSESLDTDEERAIEEDRRASQARDQDDYLSGGTSATLLHPASGNAVSTSSTNLAEPLRPDQRWLGLHRRAGIGMIPKTSSDISQAIRAKASTHPSTSSQDTAAAEADFRTRISRQQQQRHDLNLLTRARRTLVQLDQSASTEYNPLWLDSELYHVLSGHTPSSLDAGTIDERMQRDPAFKEAVELLQLVFSSEDEEEVNEAKIFVGLQTKAQLELVLDCLRSRHRYCLFCGCQYASEEELARCCPGLEEDDHD